MIHVDTEARKPNLSGTHGVLLHLDKLRDEVARLADVMQVPDVEVIGAKLPEGRVEILRGLAGVPIKHLAGDVNALPVVLERLADQAFVVSTHVDTGSVEMVDPDIRGPLDDTGIRRDHATETNSRDFQAGPAEDAVAQLRSKTAGFVLSRIRGRQAEPPGKKRSTRRVHAHEESPPKLRC